METILIEGPDCSGKSTLIEEMFPSFVKIHNGRYPSQLAAYSAYLEQCDKQRSSHIRPNTVYDRMHISEIVYAHVMRGITDIPDYFKQVENRLLSMHCVLVVCLPHFSSVIKAWRNRLAEEYVQDDSKIIEIYEYYSYIHNITGLPTLFYDYENVEFNSIYPLLSRINEIRMNMYDQ